MCLADEVRVVGNEQPQVVGRGRLEPDADQLPVALHGRVLLLVAADAGDSRASLNTQHSILMERGERWHRL